MVNLGLFMNLCGDRALYIREYLWMISEIIFVFPNENVCWDPVLEINFFCR